jgi:peroxiredoxin
MRTIKTILLLLLSTACFAGQPKVGEKAIDFTLKSFEGDVIRLSDLRGKVVLLDFWASWCVPCREELPLLDILQRTYGSRDFTVLVVNIDNHEEKARIFLEQLSVRLNPLWDSDKKVVSAYDVEKMPTTFILDKEGRIRYIHSGFETEQFHEYKQQIEYLLQGGGKKSSAEINPAGNSKG